MAEPKDPAATNVSRTKNWTKTIKKLIEFLREQSIYSEGEKPVIKKAMLSYLQDAVPEFENFNHLSLAMFLHNAEIIELSS